jgi:hypothetical protein
VDRLARVPVLLHSRLNVDTCRDASSYWQPNQGTCEGSIIRCGVLPS